MCARLPLPSRLLSQEHPSPLCLGAGLPEAPCNSSLGTSHPSPAPTTCRHPHSSLMTSPPATAFCSPTLTLRSLLLRTLPSSPATRPWHGCLPYSPKRPPWPPFLSRCLSLQCFRSSRVFFSRLSSFLTPAREPHWRLQQALAQNGATLSHPSGAPCQLPPHVPRAHATPLTHSGPEVKEGNSQPSEPTV